MTYTAELETVLEKVNYKVHELCAKYDSTSTSEIPLTRILIKRIENARESLVRLNVLTELLDDKCTRTLPELAFEICAIRLFKDFERERYGKFEIRYGGEYLTTIFGWKVQPK